MHEYPEGQAEEAQSIDGSIACILLTLVLAPCTVTDTIFKATYSSVPVYEMPCKGVAVMKRRSDGWLNATQVGASSQIL